jgi:hypothetical protein
MELTTELATGLVTMELATGLVTMELTTELATRGAMELTTELATRGVTAMGPTTVATMEATGSGRDSAS